VDVRQHRSLDEAERVVRALRQRGDSDRSWLFSGKARRSYWQAPVEPGDALVFGRESVGLPEVLLERRADAVVGLPTLGEVRSLNLANAVAVAVYDGLRRCGLLEVDPARR
jgi:tRNA (cytidine/uridine-2'-O-)-methyltransferase